MLKKVIISSALLIFTSNSYAVIEDKAFAKCAAINGDLSRLECFDNLAKVNNLDGKQPQPTNISGKGKWNVTVDINPVDDSKTVTLMLEANSGKNKWGKSVYLVARCQSNSTNAIIGWNDYLGRDASVLTRIDKNKAVTKRWGMSTDSKATFHPKPIDFLKKVQQSNKLIAQITPYNSNPVTAIFDTEGLENVIKPLRETCNW